MSSAGASRTSSGETRRPSRSGNLNAGNGVPSGSIVDGVAVMRSFGRKTAADAKQPASPGSCAPTLTTNSAEREGQYDRDEHRSRLAETGSRPEPPLLGGFDGFLIEAEC